MGYDPGPEIIYMYIVFEFLMDVAKMVIGIGAGGYLAIRLGCPRVKRCEKE